MRLLLIPLIAGAVMAAPASPASPQVPDGLYAEIRTSKGLIVARLEPQRTPMTVANFVGLAEGTIANDAFDPGVPYYDGTIFHRVVPGHVIQAGAPAPERSSARGPGYVFPNEIHAELSHDHAGALGMANSGPHTNSAQFYITLGDRSYLDGDYPVFGEVVEGLDVVRRIEQGDVVESVTIIRVGAAARAFEAGTESFQALVEAARARVEDDAADRVRLELEYVRLNHPEASAGAGGLRHAVRRPGDGELVQVGDRLQVRYVGTALRYRGHMLGMTGPVFEEVRFGSSAADGAPRLLDADAQAEAFEYEVGVTRVNPGVDASIAAMSAGEQRLVIVPAAQAYGERGHYGPSVAGVRRFVISPNTMLIYGIEVGR
jgi:peptidylprolyl isomerase